MPLENEGNPEGLQLLRESLRKVQLESPDKVSLFICGGTETDLEFVATVATVGRVKFLSAV